MTSWAGVESLFQLELDGEGGVKAILLDEEGFWKPLVAALKVRAQQSILNPNEMSQSSGIFSSQHSHSCTSHVLLAT